MVMVFLGTTQRVQQNYHAALETLNSALGIYQVTNQHNVVIEILSQIARIRREQGLLKETVQVCNKALKVADRYTKGDQHRLPTAAYTMGILGRIYYEWNQLDLAMEIGLHALALSERWGQANTLMGNHLFLSKIFRVQGLYQEALKSVLAAQRSGGRFSETHEFVIRTHEAIIRLAMGDIDFVERWVKQESVSYETHQGERLWELAPLILALFREKYLDDLDELIKGLNQLQVLFKKSGNSRRSLQSYILEAMIYKALRNYDQALTALENALTLGKSEGYIRSFLDQGTPMENLLMKAITAGIQRDYATRLHTALLSDKDLKLHFKDREPALLVEELTDREMEVLRLLSTNLTVPQIADELVITVGTLRTHIKRIYGKLDVHSRFEATTRASELL
jgi:LuxR family maltose regulon positive regulatory protein